MRPFLSNPSYLLSLALLLLWSTQSQATPTATDSVKAGEIAEQVIERLGGMENWDNTRYLSWTIFGQNHVWDKWSGDFRVEHDSTVVYLNVNSKEGMVWVNGDKLDDGSEAKILESAYGRWVNNSYWVVMPYKILDPGTHLSYLGSKSLDLNGSATDVEQIELTFDQVGLTPQNKYVLSVDADNKIVQWDFYGDRNDEKPRFALPWYNWEAYGDIWLSTGRQYVDNTRFGVTNLKVPDSIPPMSFSSPINTGLFD